MPNLVEVTVATPTLPAIVAAQDAAGFAEIVVVDSPAMAEVAASEYDSARKQHDALDAARQKLKRPVLDAGIAIDNFFRPALTHLDGAAKILQRKLSVWMRQQEAERQAAENKAREAALAEQRRIAAEAAAREAKARAEAEALRKRAEAEQQAGNAAAAAQLANQATNTELVAHQDVQERLALADSVQPAAIDTPRLPGSIQGRIRWVCDEASIDIKVLADAVARGDAPAAAIKPDMQFLNGMAARLKGEFKIRGCKAVPEHGIRRTGRQREASGLLDE